MSSQFKTKKNPFYWFNLFKYTIYGLLIVNVIFFLNRDLGVVAHRFSNDMKWTELIDAFSNTIDTAAWVVLILIFELETYILSGKKIQSQLNWPLRIIRGICYFFVCYAFYGYAVKYPWIMDFAKVDIGNICELKGLSWMTEPDIFQKIDSANCQKIGNEQHLLQKNGESIYTDVAQWTTSFWLVFVDILNSGVWILVVIVLEIDIWLQRLGRFKGIIYQTSKFIKALLYTLLLGAAIYWGVQSSFLNFWDAFLWIVAFVFIESNLFGWQVAK